MTTEVLTTEQIRKITLYVDIQAPPGDHPTAHVIFGTNQLAPIDIVAERYHRGLAPLIIATGGVNRHNGIIEGREFHRLLLERGVPDEVIRVEDHSADTWQNVEYALPYLREAHSVGLPITAISKWYHRRAIHALTTLASDLGPFHALSWEPIYDETLVTRTTWPDIPAGKRRVVREWEEIPRRVADGNINDARLDHGAWN